MPSDILGIATTRPSGVITQDQALQLAVSRSDLNARRRALLARLYSHSTIRSRASTLIGPTDRGSPLAALEHYYPPCCGGNGHGPTVSQRMKRYLSDAPKLAHAAARRALDVAKISPEQVTQVVTVSCTGLASPGIDTALVRDMGLPPTTGRTMIGFMGCHGAINGMRVASALASTTPGSCVLLCMVELCTLHFQYGWDPGRVLANGLFADGAAAAVIGPASNDETPGNGWRLSATGSCLFPDSEADMAWLIGDHGFEMSLSSRVPELISEHLAGWLTGWLAEQDLSLDEVKGWVIHPGGPKVIDAVASAMHLTDEETAASRKVLAECGNMSSPTVMFILERLAEQRRTGPCVMLAFGPGLVVEAALLK